MSISKRIKETRKMFKLTQEDFGSKIGISQRMVSKIENDKCKIKSEHLKKILEIFSINPNWLIFGKGDVLRDEFE